MKKISWLLMLCVVLAVGFGTSMADDETRFPPLDNSGKRGMIQALSNGNPRQLAWSPNSQDLIVSAIGGTWVYDTTQPDSSGYALKESTLTHHVAFAPHHDIYISYSPRDYCPYGHCEDAQQVFVRDANTHEVLHEIAGMTDISVQFSHDGELVAVSSRYYGIVIWRTASFRENIGKDPSEFYQCQVKTPAEAGRAMFSMDDTLVTYTGWRSSPMMSPGDYSIWFWDTQTCEVHLQVQIFPDDYESYPPPIVNMYIYNPNGPFAIIQDYENDGKLHIWDAQARADLGTIPDGLPHIWGFMPDNQHLLLKKAGSLAQIWHIQSQTVTRSFYADEFYMFDDTALLMLRAGDVYRITTTDETLLFDDEAQIIDIKVSDDKQWLFLYYADGSQKLWDITTQTVIGAWEKAIGNQLSPDKSKIAWIEDNKVYIWDLIEHRQWQLNYFSNVGRHILWSATDNTMVTYTSTSDSPTELLNVHYIYNTPAFHVWTLTDDGFERRWGKEEFTTIVGLDDEVVITMNGDALLFWDVMTGELVHATTKLTCAMATEPDPFCARWDATQTMNTASEPIIPIVERNGGQIRIQNPNLPDEILSYTLPDHIAQRFDTISDIEWLITPDGDVLVRIGAVVYNITQDTAMQMGYVRGDSARCRTDCTHIPVRHMWLSDDGSRLFGSGSQEDEYFSVTTNRILTAWDTQTGEHLYTIDGSLDDFIQLSPDGQYVFVLGSETYVGMGKTFYNRDAKVYDAQTGDFLLYADTYDDNALDVDVSPNRRFVVVHSDNSRVWAIVEP